MKCSFHGKQREQKRNNRRYYKINSMIFIWIVRRKNREIDMKYDVRFCVNIVCFLFYCRWFCFRTFSWSSSLPVCQFVFRVHNVLYTICCLILDCLSAFADFVSVAFNILFLVFFATCFGVFPHMALFISKNFRFSLYSQRSIY